MGVFDLFKKQKTEEGLDTYLGAAQNALFGRGGLMEMLGQKNEMVSPFKVATVSVVQPKYENLHQ